jgi:hypothetical protein
LAEGKATQELPLSVERYIVICSSPLLLYVDLAANMVEPFAAIA